VVGVLPPAQGWEGQEAYQAILGVTPRIVLGSLLAYFAGEFSNSYVLARMKVWTQGRWLWSRTIGSTIMGEAVDTILFVCIAFLGTMEVPLLRSVILSNYVFKVGVEALATPVTYAVSNYLKRVEKVDHFDVHTDFNPFRAKAG
jgi:queuosine precursor transporter